MAELRKKLCVAAICLCFVLSLVKAASLSSTSFTNTITKTKTGTYASQSVLLRAFCSFYASLGITLNFCTG
ncbi:hypothetical protein SNE40_013863 [Patella caerulea]|uniref:CASP-like protein n=1 Tax=Patella caerulea TaxID=87958 RepID=A0AAN8PPJ0_PATCE